MVRPELGAQYFSQKPGKHAVYGLKKPAGRFVLNISRDVLSLAENSNLSQSIINAGGTYDNNKDGGLTAHMPDSASLGFKSMMSNVYLVDVVEPANEKKPKRGHVIIYFPEIPYVVTDATINIVIANTTDNHAGWNINHSTR